jgi:hypothetical protein
VNAPSRIQYNEAIRFAKTRLKITDPELKDGQVEILQHGAMISPYGREGSFAIVYKFKTKSGRLRALRCFKTFMPPDIQQRYERIGPYFQAHAPDVTANFHYHHDGIAIKWDGGPTQVYPIIEMEWVEGVNLVDRVDELCRKRDHLGLGQLAMRFRNLIVTLTAAQIAQGDLSGSDVMVRPNGDLVLVDYDGVYIPDFAGLEGITLGQQDYQHPRVSERAFDERMDDFSALVIYTALLALSVKPHLWQKHTSRDPQGKLLNQNMLFLAGDFSNPQQSQVFKDLEQLGDADVTTMVRELKRACELPVALVVLPASLFDPNQQEKKALADFELALKTGDDAQIVSAWKSILDSYSPAQAMQPRYLHAKARVEAFQRFIQALGTDDDQTITASYDSVLDASPQISADQRQRLEVARTRPDLLRRFQIALYRNDDAQIIALYDPILDAKLNDDYRKRLQQARQMIEIPQRVRAAITADDDAAIVQALDGALARIRPQFAADEQQRIELALRRDAVLQQLRQALASDDDAVIVQAYDLVLDQARGVRADERQRLELARSRTAALQLLQKAIYSNQDDQIVDVYDSHQALLDGYAKVGASDTQRVFLARQRRDAHHQFEAGLSADDDGQILVAYRALQIAAGYTPSSTGQVHLPPEQIERVRLAERREAALPRFRQALANDNDVAIVQAYDPVLDQARGVRAEERERLELARARQGAERGGITLMEIRVEGTAAPVLPGQEEIDQQRRLLANYRERLAYQLEQAAIIGAAAPYSLIKDIREARDEIRRLKNILRGWGAAVDDRPDDKSYGGAIEDNPWKPRELRLDAAAPKRVYLEETFDLAVQVRQPLSPALKEEKLPKVKSGSVQVYERQVYESESKPYVQLRLHARAPNCEILGGDSISFRLYGGEDSPRFYFQLIPKIAGEIGIVVTVYQQDDSLGSTRVPIVAQERVAGKVSLNVPNEAVDKRALREAMVQTFNLDEVDVLCADVEQDLAGHRITLAVNMELVGGSGKIGKILNLITYLDRRGHLGYLVAAVRRARPGSI